MNARVKAMLWGGAMTPRGWVVRAGLIFAAFSVLHLLGWRADTKIISGTGAPTDFAGQLAAARGVVYGFVYFAAVVAAPILIIAAGLRVAVARVIESGHAASTESARSDQT